jgi:hypothetical protein
MALSSSRAAFTLFLLVGSAAALSVDKSLPYYPWSKAHPFPKASSDQLPRSTPEELQVATDRPCLIANGTDVVNNFLHYDTEVAIFCVRRDHLRPSSDWEVKVSVSAIYPTILRLAFAARSNRSSPWEIVAYDPDEKIKLHLDEHGKVALPASLPYRPQSSGKEIVDDRTDYDLMVFRKALANFTSHQDAEAADILLLLIATAESVAPLHMPQPSSFWFDIRLDALIFNALPFRVIYLFPAAAICVLAIGWGVIFLEWLLQRASYSPFGGKEAYLRALKEETGSEDEWQQIAYGYEGPAAKQRGATRAAEPPSASQNRSSSAAKKDKAA